MPVRRLHCSFILIAGNLMPPTAKLSFCNAARDGEATMSLCCRNRVICS
jgi:hypothetical protein